MFPKLQKEYDKLMSFSTKWHRSRFFCHLLVSLDWTYFAQFRGPAVLLEAPKSAVSMIYATWFMILSTQDLKFHIN